MTIDFTDEEINLIFDALEELRVTSPADQTLDLIQSIMDKIWILERK
jgi:hypothetical protein